jgi:hypothetical protein
MCAQPNHFGIIRLGAKYVNANLWWFCFVFRKIWGCPILTTD